MSGMRAFLRNIRSLFTDDWTARENANQSRVEKLTAQLKTLEAEKAEKAEIETHLRELVERLDSRADAYEAAVDTRLTGRFTAIDSRLDEYQVAVDERIEGRAASFEKRLDEYQTALDARTDARLETAEKALDDRLASHTKNTEERSDALQVDLDARLDRFENALTQRLETFESASTDRATEYEAALDSRIEERLAQTDQMLETHVKKVDVRFDDRLREAMTGIDLRFDERSRATDSRLDERLVRMERNIDARFNALEDRSDGRMETHERTVDGRLHQRSQDIVDRTDLMLQIFEQRLDKFRRGLHSLEVRKELSQKTPAASGPEMPEGSVVDPMTNGSGELSQTEAASQLVSFRKLAEIGAQSLKRVAEDATPLYHQILAWKKVAHEGLGDFAPHEREIADYMLSFQSDPREIAYVSHHMRRFLSTLERIPPAESPSDRVLELGSLGHMAPAIVKYRGYREICCADMWDGAKKTRRETMRQNNGTDSLTFELRNFNVEVDAFPYADGHFRGVICCELIEHLQRDPLHMLWESNRVLRDGGFLLLTTPNIASTRAIEGVLAGCTPYHFSQFNLREAADQHNREYAPYEVGVVLAAAGFSVIDLETEDVWLRSNPAIIELLRDIKISADLRGDNIFALARKVSAPLERYPKELYID